jgi:alanine-glyoxylate transaminase/serine-glyoxylate transaminase/serine-pyruvate transaminase
MPSSPYPAERILLGPGPSPVPARVLHALGAPTVRHLGPQHLSIAGETCESLRPVFRTRNALTFPVSGTGMAGMECLAVNLVEPGDEVIIGVNGVFGGRMKDVMERCGATVHALEAPWGEVFTLDQIAAALVRHPRAKIVALVRAETSTGRRRRPRSHGRQGLAHRADGPRRHHPERRSGAVRAPQRARLKPLRAAR